MNSLLLIVVLGGGLSSGVGLVGLAVQLYRKEPDLFAELLSHRLNLFHWVRKRRYQELPYQSIRVLARMYQWGAIVGLVGFACAILWSFASSR